MVKIFAWLFVAFNLYMGGDFFQCNRCLANQQIQCFCYLDIRHCAVVDGRAGAYFCAFKGDCKTVLWIGAAAWVVIFYSCWGI